MSGTESADSDRERSQAARCERYGCAIPDQCLNQPEAVCVRADRGES